MQAKFAPIVPPKLLPVLKEKELLGDYNLLLVQEVLEHQDLFQDVFHNHPSFNILDNGVIETGKSYSADDMYQAAVACSANMIILPDVIGDTNATLNIVKTTKPFFDKVFGGTHMRYICVPQGRSIEEIIFCAGVMSELVTVGMWGVPRSIVKTQGTRSDVIFKLNQAHPQIGIHLLGFSDNMIDDIACARHMPVVGIDSSLPCLLGGAGWDITLDPQKGGRTYRKHDKLGKAAWDNMGWSQFIGLNIEHVRRWIGD